MIAKAYHAYDMNRFVHWIAHRIERDYGILSGGFRRDENGDMVPFEHDPIPFTMPHCALQDERCYKLSRKGWTKVAMMDLDYETYVKLGGFKSDEASRAKTDTSPQ